MITVKILSVTHYPDFLCTYSGFVWIKESDTVKSSHVIKDFCSSSNFDENWSRCSTHQYYNLTNFHQNLMKNEKYLLIAIFASVRFFLYQSLLQSYIMYCMFLLSILCTDIILLQLRIDQEIEFAILHISDFMNSIEIVASFSQKWEKQKLAISSLIRSFSYILSSVLISWTWCIINSWQLLDKMYIFFLHEEKQSM